MHQLLIFIFFMDSINELKLFMLLLGSRAPGRHVEQHDFFFAIAHTLKELVPAIKSFWPEAKGNLHIDGWREMTNVDGYRIKVKLKEDLVSTVPAKRLFFINLGGYQENKFEEQHYTLLTVKDNRAQASKEAKDTFFYKHHGFKGATSHIDDKYGIDVDDLYEIEDILPAEQKEVYRIELSPEANLSEDKLHLGYFKLNAL